MGEGGAFDDTEGVEGRVGICVAEVREYGDEPGDGEGLGGFYVYTQVSSEERYSARSTSYHTYPSHLLPRQKRIHSYLHPVYAQYQILIYTSPHPERTL